jgi:hypothetical protein
VAKKEINSGENSRIQINEIADANSEDRGPTETTQGQDGEG